MYMYILSLCASGGRGPGNVPERLRGPDQLRQRHQLLLSQPGDSGAARGVLLDGAQTCQDLQLSKAGPSDGTVVLILSISKTWGKSLSPLCGGRRRALL